MTTPDQPAGPIPAIGSLGIRQKLSVTFSLVIILIMLLTVLLVTFFEKGASLERARLNASMLGNLVRVSMGEDIIRGNFRGLEFALKEFGRMPVVRYCAIVNNQGKIVAAINPELAGRFMTDPWTLSHLRTAEVDIRRAFYQGEPVTDACIPVRVGTDNYGVIRLGFSLQPEFDYLRTILIGNLTLALLFIFIGILVSIAISRNILAPISDLLSATEKVGAGDLTTRTDIQTADEFEQLGSSFNRMTLELKKKEMLKKFCSPNIWEDAGTAEGELIPLGRRQEGAILVSDIRGFAGFAERHPPEEVIDYLNRYFDHLARAVTDSGGLIDKFVGDSLIAVFLPSGRDRWSPEQRAVFAGLRMRRALQEFNLRQAELGLEEFRTGIGIHSGPMILGTVGSTARLEFTALGDSVSRAAELENGSRAGTLTGIFISGALKSRVRDYLVANQVSGLNRSGKGEPSEVFEIASLGNLPYLLEEFHHGTPEQKAELVLLISFVGSAEARKFLEQTIRNASPELAAEAVKALGTQIIQGSEEARAFLMNLLETSKEGTLLSQAVSVLALARDPKLAGFFQDLLRSPVPRIRANALQALLPLEFPGKGEVFRKMAGDEHHRVVANSLLGLWVMDDPMVMPGLVTLLTAAESPRRCAGAFALGTLSGSLKFRAHFESRGGGAAPTSNVGMILDHLLKMIRQEDPAERLQAVRALGPLGNAHTFKDLTTLIARESDAEVLAETEKALERLRNRLGTARP